MSDHKEHITHYSAADIRRYVQGQLSAKEMHAIEKAALDDPFLADAIEGMQQALEAHEEAAVTGQLEQLKQELQARTAQKSNTGKVVAFRWWQVAAAAVVVIIAGAWIFTLLTSPNEANAPELVVVKQNEGSKENQYIPEPAVPNENKVPATSDSDATQSYSNGLTGNSRTVTRDSKELSQTLQHTKPARRSSAVPEPPKAAAPAAVSSFADAKQITKDENKPAEEKQPMAAAAKAREVPVTESKKETFGNRETELITIAKNDSPAKAMFDTYKDKNLSGVIKGRVIDQNNNPIANAYLQLPNNKVNFVTDNTGFFKIPASADSVVDVSVNVAGYGTQNFRLQNNASMNQLQMQPAMALNEVEVKPIKVRKASALRKKMPNVMVQDAEPVYGWVAFDQYLEKNKKIPLDNSNLSGNVIVSFELNKAGDLSDIKIEQSLAKAYDDEAIRLIKEGPAWKLLKGRKARVTVIVRF